MSVTQEDSHSRLEQGIKGIMQCECQCEWPKSQTMLAGYVDGGLYNLLVDVPVQGVITSPLLFLCRPADDVDDGLPSEESEDWGAG